MRMASSREEGNGCSLVFSVDEEGWEARATTTVEDFSPRRRRR